MTELCPCGNKCHFADCCQPFLLGKQTAPTPLALMRSRYSAYATNNIDYLIKTWHPSCRAEQWRQELITSCNDTEWLGLTIISTREGKSTDEGFVEFMARSRAVSTTQQQVMHECSRFLYQQGEWFYTDGTHVQLSRNSACPCGSGKKYKRCCGQSN